MTTLKETPAQAPRVDARRAFQGLHWFHPHAIAAITRRDFLRYFFNPTGYVFIALFVLFSAGMAFWLPSFFTRNLANFDMLNGMMPYLLLFFVPAITMSIWADERRQGTDELLLTLPATDFDVVLGKYLAVLGTFTTALAFTFSLVPIMAWLGVPSWNFGGPLEALTLLLGIGLLIGGLTTRPASGANGVIPRALVVSGVVIVFLALLRYVAIQGAPDLGTVLATYLGYWLMGAMLLAIGMLASQLTANVTVGFILGAAFCALPLFAGLLGSPASTNLRRQIEDLSVPAQFADFGTGVVSFSGVFYFLSAAAGVLFINVLLLGRRHWAGGERSLVLWAHSLTRAAAVILALAAFNVLVGRVGLRADITAERLHTLSSESRALLDQIPRDKPVYIQAYFSPEVPREFVQTKADLVGLLKEYAARGGDRVRLNLVETDVYSPAARDAEKRFGIEPRRVTATEEGKQTSAEIILGVAFSSGLEEVVIPFFDRGLSPEYELTRSIRVVSRAARKKVGILATDAKLMGGFDMRSMGRSPEWSIATELKKQYDVSTVAADVDIPADLDVLLVAQPSSLTQKQIDILTAYVKRGGPTLLFLDPLPFMDPQISPEVPKMPPGGPFGGGPPPEPKGDLKPLLDLLGIEWPTTEIVWNPYNPLQQRPDLPPEIVFIGKGSGAENPFNPDEIVSSGLQEVVAIFGGHIRSKGGPGTEFTPLLRTNSSGGTIQWSEATRQGFMGISGVNPERRHFSSGDVYTLAAHIKGDAPATPPPPVDPAKKDQPKPPESKPAKLHAIAIADLDLISEEFFELRRQKVESLELDNVTFVLNCVDVLAGDDAFVALRKRRIKHRTLLRLEQESKQFIDQYQREFKAAEDEAKKQLDLAQKNLDKDVDALNARKDVDPRTREILLQNLRDVATRRLDVQKVSIEDEKRRTILDSKAESEQNIRRIQNRVRTYALALPPIPPLILAFVIFAIRRRRENLGANPNRIA